MIDETTIRNLLKEVKDPEIPAISIVDLGIVTDISVLENQNVKIKLTPTFAGCPALKLMENMVAAKLKEVEEIGEVSVETSFDITWTTDMITEEGREAIKNHGLAPPKRNCSAINMEVLKAVSCPYCNSEHTSLKSPFGPTLCRSLHYCNNCKQAFEGFKPL